MCYEYKISPFPCLFCWSFWYLFIMLFVLLEPCQSTLHGCSWMLRRWPLMRWIYKRLCEGQVLIFVLQTQVAALCQPVLHIFVIWTHFFRGIACSSLIVRPWWHWYLCDTIVNIVFLRYESFEDFQFGFWKISPMFLLGHFCLWYFLLCCFMIWPFHGTLVSFVSNQSDQFVPLLSLPIVMCCDFEPSGMSFQSLDWCWDFVSVTPLTAPWPGVVFPAHFMLTHTHPRTAFRSVIHHQIAPGQTRLT
jgi:hypothetical protein